MNWNTLRGWLATVIRLGLGAVWLWAGLSKIHDPRAFTQTVRAYDATPEWLSKGIGYGLPVLEICLGVLLVLGAAVRLAAIASAVLFAVFLIAVAQAGARGIRLDCGCFGGGGLTSGGTHYTLDILRDIGLLILAVFLALYSMTRVSVESYLARNDYVEPPSAKRMRTDQGQRKYNAMLEARQRAARERARYLNASLAIVVVLIALIGAGVQAGRAKITGATTATNATVGNGVVYGQKAAATVDVYEDFQCPHCLEFERSTHSTLEADVKANKVQLRYHPMSFLDASSNGNKYSSRAANAALCASDVSVDEFVKYHDILFTAAVQPAEGSSGRSDTDFVKYAQQSGLSTTQVQTFTTCAQNHDHAALVQAITENASKKGINSTPTVLVNGTKLSTADLPTLEKAIAAADAKGPAPSASPAPSPSASGSASAGGSPAVSPAGSSVAPSVAPSGSATP